MTSVVQNVAIICNQKSGPMVSNVGAITQGTDLIDQVTLPPNYLTLGKTFRLTVMGILSVVGQGTTFNLNFSISNGSTIVTGLPLTVSKTLFNEPFCWNSIIRVNAIGTLGNLIGVGTLVCLGVTRTAGQVPSINSAGFLMAPATAPAVSASVNTTIVQTLDIRTNFGTANNGNAATIHFILIEELN